MKYTREYMRDILTKVRRALKYINILQAPPPSAG
jgi:hypothetical protein